MTLSSELNVQPKMNLKIVGCLKSYKTSEKIVLDLLKWKEIGKVCFTADRKDNSTLDESRQKLFSIWKPQGKIWNKKPFLINTFPLPLVLSSYRRERIGKEEREGIEDNKCHMYAELLISFQNSFGQTERYVSITYSDRSALNHLHFKLVQSHYQVVSTTFHISPPIEAG